MVSVIIPVYNNEKYLPQLFNNILNQTYKEFEVIFVNDGSTDNSLALLEEFCKNNSKASCYSKENGGVSSARNLALEKAKGEYIVFWDADDIISDQFLAVMVASVENNCLTICGFSFLNENNVISEKLISNNEIDYIDKNQVSLMQQYWLFNALWNKIFFKDIIVKENIVFNENLALGEDTLFISEYVKYVNEYKVINRLLYTYVRREKSAMTKYHKNIYSSHVQIYETIINSLDSKKENYESCLTQVKYAFGTSCIANVWHLVHFLNKGSKGELKKALRHYNTSKNVIKPKVNLLLRILLKTKNVTLLKLYYKLFLKRG